MTTRMKVLVGVSTLALWSGLTPAIPAMLAPAADELGAAGLAAFLMPDAQAQEGEGEEGSECTPPEGESGEGEEGGTTECTPPDGESGEGEG